MVEIEIRKGVIPAVAASLMRKPRIAIIYDTDGWAFHRIAIRLRDYFNEHGYKAASYNAGEKLSFDNFDALLLVWWGAISPELWRKIPQKTHVFVFVYDHFIHRGGHALAKLRQVVFRSSVLFVGSEMLAQELRDRAICRNPVILTDGVDADFFKFVPMQTKAPGDLVVGWAGNRYLEGDLKGVDIIQEACDEVGLKFQMAERHISPVPFEEMPAWYAQIDIYACASRSEAGPNPILEAAAVGRPIISTKVGIVPKLLGVSNGGLLVDRSVGAFVDGLRRLQIFSENLPEWGRRNREEIERHWTWRPRLELVEKTIRKFLKG